MKPYIVLVLGLIIMSVLFQIAIPTNADSNSPSIAEIKQAVQKAVNYIDRLTRHLDNYRSVVAEYPALPIVIYDPDGVSTSGGIVDQPLWFIPGLKMKIVGGKTYIKFEGFSIETSDEYTKYYWTFYPIVYYSGTEYPLAEIKVTEYRSESLSYVMLDIVHVYPCQRYGNLVFTNARIYVGGDYLGDVVEGNSYGITLPDPLPSMRFSVRHVNDIVSSTYYALDNLNTDIMHIDNNIRYIQNTLIPLGSSNDKYDIYARTIPDEYDDGIKVYTNSIYNNFFDAVYWNDKLGYDKIYDWYNSLGLIKTVYPAYPYKSKIVRAAEIAHSTPGASIDLVTGDSIIADFDNGGYLFLKAMELVKDPLYYEYYALYYIQQGKYDDAYQEWTKIIEKWDGTGIYCSWQSGYSTVRLALAIAIGSILYDKGYSVSKATLDSMVNVLLQLQWQGAGHYTPDGNTVYYIYKPDHTGGFLVSYGEIGSYGFVPFRPGLLDAIFDIVGAMGDEYPGVLPTNAETTLLSINALICYAYYVLGVPPNQLLG